VITLNCIEVNGSYKARRVLAEDVVEFCIGELMPRMKTLWVDVRLKSMIGEDATGFCWEGDHNREFYLEIKQSLDKEEFIETVCHEMVHVWQGVTKKMAEKSNKRLWLCKDGKYRNYSDVDYAKQPWEVEAYRMEGPLSKKYKEINYGVAL
jgi:hypothetical protein